MFNILSACISAVFFGFGYGLISVVFSYDDINAAGNGIKEVDPMPRRNHPKHTHNDIKYFDIVQVYEPDHADVRKFISMPRKTIFVNMAASPSARVIRVGWDICDTLQHMPTLR